VLAAAILGSSITFVDATVVNVALPVLQGELGASVVEAQWIVEAYAPMLASLILVGDSLGDHLGRAFTQGRKPGQDRGFGGESVGAEKTCFAPVLRYYQPIPKTSRSVRALNFSEKGQVLWNVYAELTRR
jgi:hypothetical protein